eukprot:CAMPEP_0175017314 /NCGR_PEP_ID=MMETSP0005-20121125/12327_1 /TAXON_ID=420556 /ORGANISM="Ochromonas sp., Strain CCMP1393" /LENGTH=54 /DNA_ID=CAMNT_0016274711 /DNA_START=208 /DNA_END=372 /DNA_ORIENTATION=+
MDSAGICSTTADSITCIANGSSTGSSIGTSSCGIGHTGTNTSSQPFQADTTYED